MKSYIKTNPNRYFDNFLKILFVSSFLSLYCFCFGYSPEDPAVAEGKVLHIFSFLLSKNLIKQLWITLKKILSFQ